MKSDCLNLMSVHPRKGVIEVWQPIPHQWLSAFAAQRSNLVNVNVDIPQSGKEKMKILK